MEQAYVMRKKRKSERRYWRRKTKGEKTATALENEEEEKVEE